MQPNRNSKIKVNIVRSRGKPRNLVREQAGRWVVYEALRNGHYYPWDYQPLQKASERYMRNHMDLNVLEDSKRFPRGE